MHEYQFSKLWFALGVLLFGVGGSMRASGGGGPIRLLGAYPGRIEIECRAPKPAIVPLEFAGKSVSAVRAAGAMYLRRRGYPELPFYLTRVTVPVGTKPRVVVLRAEWREVRCSPPLPSPGFVSRSGAAGPRRRFGGFYREGGTFPEIPVRIGARWTIHGVAGATVVFYPYRYDAGRRVLRYCTRMVVAIRSSGAVRAFGRRALSPVFRRLLERSLLNRGSLPAPGPVRGAEGAGGAAAAAAGARAPAAAPGESGRLLLIGPADLLAAMSDFITWKRQRGLVVETARYPADTGSGSAALKNFIQGKYDTEDLDFVILVGDETQVPVTVATDVDSDGIPSDTVLSLTDGNDYYPDLLISRICAESADAVENQAAKFVRYEKNPPHESGGGAWLARGTCIGSDQGAANSAFGKNDKEILAEERIKWRDYGYTQVDGLFDPDVTASDISTVLNQGRGLVYYLGHGSTTSWNTGEFGVNDAYALQNGARTPFIVVGACHIGDFNMTGDCLAEAFMKAGSRDAPAGAVGIVASTTAMDWDPPIVMLQAFTGYLTEQSSFTAGGMTFENDALPGSAGLITVLSIERAMDYCVATPAEGDTPAEKIMEQTQLFGDCTLGLRTRVPKVLQVTHPSLVAANQAFPVTVTFDDGEGGAVPVAGATVCLYRAPDVQASATTDASGQAVLSTPVDPGAPVKLTVYQREYLPYQADIEVGGGALRIYSASTLPTAFVGEAYHFSLLATGGTAPYAWSLVSPEAAPSWLSLDSATGVLSGTPDAAGDYTFTVRVADSATRTTAEQEVHLAAGRAVQLGAGSLADGTVDQAYSQSLPVIGDFRPFSWELSSGALPPGLELSGSGVIFGTPARSGAYSFSIGVTDAQGRKDTRAYAIQIAASDVLVISTQSLAAGTLGEAYSARIDVHGGTGSGFTWELSGGALPAGVGLDSSTGAVQGTPAEFGEFSFAVTVKDDGVPPHTASKSFVLRVDEPVRFTGTVLPGAHVGVAYSQALPVEGTLGPITVSAVESIEYRAEAAATSSFALSGSAMGWAEDEKEWELDLPFSFPFYGQEYTHARVGDDGYLLLGDSPVSPSPMWEATESALEGCVMIAPFWNDLVMDPVQYPGTGVYVEQSPDSLTVRWCGREYDHLDDPEWVLNFSVTLTPDGGIRFRYGRIKTNNRVVIGVSNGAGQAVVLFSQDKAYTDLDPDAEPPAGSEFWNGHADERLLRLAPLPSWLELSSSGILSGTPPVAGPVYFGVTAVDAGGNTAVAALTLPVSAQPGFVVAPERGWNCLSLPVAPLDDSPGAVFPGHLGPVWHWDASRQAYEAAASIQALQGYWVYFRTAPAPYFVAGNAPGSGKIQGYAGWNVVGPAANRSVPVIPGQEGFVWAWRHGVFHVVDKMAPGLGYWLYLDQDGIIDLGR